MKYILSTLIVVLVLGSGLYVAMPKDQSLGGVSNYLDTSASGFTTATTSVGVQASSQVFASVSKWAEIINDSEYNITCELNSANTTSTVVAGTGIIIGRNTSSTNSLLPAKAQFGECYPGSYNCYPHKGAVNCITTATSTITTVVR